LADGTKQWFGIWMTFAAYALVLALVFPFVFKAKSMAGGKEQEILLSGSH